MKLSDCKLRIVGFFDEIINNIDFKTEYELGRCLLDESEIELVNRRRELFISHIKQLQDFNLLNLDKSYDEHEFESLVGTELDNRLFRKFCFFVDQNILGKEPDCFADDLFGRMVIVDRYISEETLAAFRELFSYNKKMSTIPLENHLFEFKPEEYYEPQFEVYNNSFETDKLIIDTTLSELFKLDRVCLEDGVVESIKDAAKPLFDHIERVNFKFNSLTPQEFCQTVQLIGKSAKDVSLAYGSDKYESDMFSLFSNLRIKSLELSSMEFVEKSFFNRLDHLEKLTIYIEQNIFIHDNVFQNLTQLKSLYIQLETRESFKLDVLTPLTELEELTIVSDDTLAVEYAPIKMNKLRKLRLASIEVDAKLMESFESLDELEIESMAELAESIKKKGPASLRKLEMTNSLLLKIDPKSFNGFDQLTSLNLQSNQITDLKKNAFLGLSSLIYLDLSENELVTIKSDAMNGLSGLMTLNLSNNSLSALEDSLFQKLRSLTHLDLGYNNLSTIRSIFCLNNLKELRLANNSIVDVDDNVFDRLEELEVLDLSKNNIKSIKANTFQSLGKLKSLHLNENSITSVDANFLNGLSGLIYLDLSNNQISSVDSKAFHPVVNSLEVLVLDQNKLKRIDHIESLFQFKSLKRLHLSENLIERLASLNGLKRLVRLDLSNNNISQIDNETFSGMIPNNLQELDLGTNSISRIEAKTFSSLQRLRYLTLAQNVIQALDKEAFIGLESVEYINLYGNRIEQLDPELFKSQIRLKKLEIVDNSIQAISIDTFSSSLKSLEELNLSYNDINFIQANSFASLPRLKVLNLNGNSELFFNLDPDLLGLSGDCKLLYPRNNRVM